MAVIQGRSLYASWSKQTMETGFWNEIDKLDRCLLHTWRQTKAMSCKGVVGGEEHMSTDSIVSQNRETILCKIEWIVLQLTESMSKGQAPVFMYNNRSAWENVRFQKGEGLQPAKEQKLTQVKFDSLNSVKKFGLMTKLLSIIYKLVQEDKYCTKRDLYYQHPELFGSQSYLDQLVDSIAAMLEVPRWELHVLATCKGSVIGDLQFYTEHQHLVDCSATRTGIQIPAHKKDMQNISTNARFVLIVEKDATFQKLIGESFCHKFAPCIMVTGKGFPDIGTRLLLRKLWDQLQLPMFVLVDADPHGIEIMAVYKYGSKAQAAENQFLAVPSIRWLGVLPTDVLRLNVQESVFIPFTKKDMDKTSELMGRPYLHDNWPLMDQLQCLMQLGRKVEIQCLDSISPSYLCDVYLPSKLRSAGWSFLRNLSKSKSDDVWWKTLHSNSCLDERLNVQESVFIPFTKKDMDKTSELMGRPYLHDNWPLMDQLQCLMQLGRKVEIQCLDSISPSYLCDVYLPSKLRSAGWV